MSFLESIPSPKRRTDRKTCQHCEAGASSCRATAWLYRRLCCEACIGDHDATEVAS